MSFVADNPEKYEGQVVGNGQCVIFVNKASGSPPSSLWTEGIPVRDNDIERGTAIATFIDGVYPNLSHGNHAAIYLEQNGTGIVVLDQWTGQPVHKRTIRWKGKENTDRSNNGDWFSVVEA